MKKNVFNGWLLVDKPAGMTSAEIIRVIKKKMNPTKIGHAGTLDPDAIGLLPIALGEATKTIPYLLKERKKYQAVFVYGEKTDSDDASGNILKASSYVPRKIEIEEALQYYSEVLYQKPPNVSAVKVNGERAYKLFRNDKIFQLSVRSLEVFKLSLRSHTEGGESVIYFECGKGGYVRSIARDVGDFLGCFAYVKKLRRLEYGPFKVIDAMRLSKLLDTSIKNLDSNIMGIESAITDLKIFNCHLDDLDHLNHGRPIRCPNALSLYEGEELVAKYQDKVAFKV